MTALIEGRTACSSKPLRRSAGLSRRRQNFRIQKNQPQRTQRDYFDYDSYILSPRPCPPTWTLDIDVGYWIFSLKPRTLSSPLFPISYPLFLRYSPVITTTCYAKYYSLSNTASIEKAPIPNNLLYKKLRLFPREHLQY